MLPCPRDCAKTRFTDNSPILQLVHRLDWKVLAADVTVVHLAVVEFVAHGGWVLLRIKYRDGLPYFRILYDFSLQVCGNLSETAIVAVGWAY